MKRILAVLFFLACILSSVTAEESRSPVSFGMQFEVDYDIITGSFSLWNLRYGIGIDFLIHLGDAFYAGLEVMALFGFHKQDINDSAFDHIYVQFPFHVSLTYVFKEFIAQIYAGISYTGGAEIYGGTVYPEDFSFLLLPDVGVKIGWGTMNNVFLKFGYVIDEYAYIGLGARLSLFGE